MDAFEALTAGIMNKFNIIAKPYFLN